MRSMDKIIKHYIDIFIKAQKALKEVEEWPVRTDNCQKCAYKDVHAIMPYINQNERELLTMEWENNTKHIAENNIYYPCDAQHDEV